MFECVKLIWRYKYAQRKKYREKSMEYSFTLHMCAHMYV